MEEKLKETINHLQFENDRLNNLVAREEMMETKNTSKIKEIKETIARNNSIILDLEFRINHKQY